MQIALKYILLLTLGFVLMKIYLRIADRFNIIDKPNSRSSHTRITVRGGGIIVPLIAFAWFISSGFQYPLFFIGLAIVSTISFLDDIFQLSSAPRFILQILSVVFLFYQLDLTSYSLLTLMVLGIIAVGILNVYNFMDGINGITAGYSLAVLSGLWLVNNFQVQFIQNDFIFFILIAIAIFSFFNFRTKAICFAGDIGSVSIAFIILFFIAKLIDKTQNPIYILFLSVYGVDSLLTILYRFWLGENILKPHRKHIYQLLVNEIRYSHLLISIIYLFAQLFICFLVYFIIRSNDDISTELGLGSILVSILLLLFSIARVVINRKVLKSND